MTTAQFWIYMLAILLSPLIAVQVTVYLQRHQERRQRRLAILRSLMSTRAAQMSGEHVAALNMIDIEFHGDDRKSKAVVAAWRAYLHHLNSAAPLEVWADKQQELLMGLIYSVALALDYQYDKTELKTTCYFPRGYGETEAEQVAIRKGLLALLSGRSSLLVTSPPATPSSGPPQQAEPTNPGPPPEQRA